MLAIADYVAQRTAGTIQPGDVGRRDVRCQHAFSAGRSVEAAASAAERIPNICFRCCCAPPTRSATRPIRTTSCEEFIREAAAQRHRHLPHLRFAELAAEHAGRGRGRARRPAASAKRRSATPATSSTRRARNTRSTTTCAWPKSWSAWARTSSASRTWPGCCKPYAAYKLVKALRDEVGVPIHFHTHDTSGINAGNDSAGGRCRRGYRRRRHIAP